MKIKCEIDNVKFNNKPQGSNVGAIINRMTIDKATEYSIEEIKNSILEGKTIRPAYCGGSEETWQSQQMFFIDIDNKPAKTKGMSDEEYKTLVEEYIKSDKYKTYEQVIEKCKSIELIPNFVYTSFNHKPEHHKMRLVFILDKNITDCETAKKVQLYLMDIIGGIDEQCKNLNRIYYAGREIVFNSDNIINTDKLIELSKNIPINTIKNKPSKQVKSMCIEKRPPDNKNIYNNTYIIRGSKTQTQVIATDTEDENYNIKAISNRDVEYLKKKINHPHMVFNNNQEFCDYIFKEINLAELLEFKYPKSIRCIFHDDNSPSAGIFQNEEGYWIYNCFGCGVSYNLLGVIEVLGKFKSRPKAYKFIRDIFNLEIQETDWQKEQKEILLENLKVLTNGELERNCPQAYKNIKRNKNYLQQLILIAMDNVYDEKLSDDDDNVLFYASNSFIAKEMNTGKESSKEISKKMALMAYHNLINKISDEEANKDMLKRSQAIGIKTKNYKHANYYSIPSYNNLLYPEIEQQGQKWKENNYTMKGLTREMFYRAEGLEVANEIYPQYKKVTKTVDGDKQIVDRTTTKASDERTNNIALVINQLIEQQGYAIEQQIIDMLGEEYKVTITAVQIKKSLAELLDAYGWQRIRANKKIKEQYNVDAEGYPFLIVQKIN